jgi:prepilin-type N-terminal cleavage/methylation domain-containing protein
MLRTERGAAGFTILELMMAMVIVAILVSLAMVAYQNYEARTRCFSAAQVLVMDLRLQQQRARTLDTQQGILFTDKYNYSLGWRDGSGAFHDAVPARRVDLQQSFNGVFVETIAGSPAFPTYVSFDPSAAGPGGWVPFGGFTGDLVLRVGDIKATVTVEVGGNVVLQGR